MMGPTGRNAYRLPVEPWPRRGIGSQGQPAGEKNCAKLLLFMLGFGEKSLGSGSRHSRPKLQQRVLDRMSVESARREGDSKSLAANCFIVRKIGHRAGRQLEPLQC